MSMRSGHRQSAAFVVSLWADEGGQDIVEYALLSGIIGIAGVLAFPSVTAKMADLYSDWIVETQDAWEPCPPGGCV
jgi:Flp pilus assembly pilin Flp